MDDLRSLNASLAKLQAITAGDKQKDEYKKLDKQTVLATIAYEYGYDAYLDAKNNKMTAKELLSLTELAQKKRYSKQIDMALALRVGLADEKNYSKIIKDWTKRAT